jgi:hypothetical protein
VITVMFQARTAEGISTSVRLPVTSLARRISYYNTAKIPDPYRMSPGVLSAHRVHWSFHGRQLSPRCARLRASHRRDWPDGQREVRSLILLETEHAPSASLACDANKRGRVQSQSRSSSRCIGMPSVPVTDEHCAVRTPAALIQRPHPADDVHLVHHAPRLRGHLKSKPVELPRVGHQSHVPQGKGR